MTPAEIAALQAKAQRADQLEADLAAANTARTAAEQRVTSFEEQNRTAARAAALVDARAALQPVVDAGRLLPAQVASVAEFMAGLDDQAKTFEFGEATGENKLTARALLVKLLEQAPAQVDYSEQTGNVQLPQNLTPDELAAKAREYQDGMASKGITVSSSAAVNAVIAGKTV